MVVNLNLKLALQIQLSGQNVDTNNKIKPNFFFNLLDNCLVGALSGQISALTLHCPGQISTYTVRKEMKCTK